MRATKGQIIISLSALVFLVFCVLAYSQVGGGGFDKVLAEPWGLVTLLDVYLGAICVSAVILTCESDKRVALAWAVPIFLLGHVVSAAWLVMRFLAKKS